MDRVPKTWGITAQMGIDNQYLDCDEMGSDTELGTTNKKQLCAAIKVSSTVAKS